MKNPIYKFSTYKLTPKIPPAKLYQHRNHAAQLFEFSGNAKLNFNENFHHHSVIKISDGNKIIAMKKKTFLDCVLNSKPKLSSTVQKSS